MVVFGLLVLKFNPEKSWDFFSSKTEHHKWFLVAQPVFQDGFADDAFAFAEEYAEFFQASRKAKKRR